MVIVVTVILYQNARLKDKLNANLQSIVNQVNDSTLYAYNFDKNQDSNIKNLDGNLKIVQDNLVNVSNNVKALQHQISSTNKNSNELLVKNVKTNNLSLGPNHSLSASNDGWIRINSSTSPELYGGLTAANLYITKKTTLQGTTNVDTINVQNAVKIPGGSSEHNPHGWATHFPHTDGINYIRGDIEIRGNATNVGDLTVQKNLMVQGGDYQSSRVNINAVGTNANWYSELQADDIHKRFGKPRALILNPRGGSVGIGDVKPRYAPKAKLHVVGDARIEDKICIGNTCIDEAQLAKIKQVTGL